MSSANNCLGLASSSPAGCFFVASSKGRVLVFDAESGREESDVEIPEMAGISNSNLAGNSNLLSTDTSVLVIPCSGKRRPVGALVLQFG